jgi:hypothetical protein
MHVTLIMHARSYVPLGEELNLWSTNVDKSVECTCVNVIIGSSVSIGREDIYFWRIHNKKVQATYMHENALIP